MKILKSIIGYLIIFALIILALINFSAVFELYFKEFTVTLFASILLMIAYYEVDKIVNKRNDKNVKREINQKAIDKSEKVYN